MYSEKNWHEKNLMLKNAAEKHEKKGWKKQNYENTRVLVLQEPSLIVSH